MLAPEEESNAEVRRVDQDNINRFARLNARLHEVERERQAKQKELELLDDASTELMMGSGNAVLLLLGEAWFETPEEEATEFAEQMVETIQTQVQGLHQEKEAIQAEQAVLKQQLYGRFGTSIQLEA